MPSTVGGQFVERDRALGNRHMEGGTSFFVFFFFFWGGRGGVFSIMPSFDGRDTFILGATTLFFTSIFKFRHSHVHVIHLCFVALFLHVMVMRHQTSQSIAI